MTSLATRPHQIATARNLSLSLLEVADDETAGLDEALAVRAGRRAEPACKPGRQSSERGFPGAAGGRALSPGGCVAAEDEADDGEHGLVCGLVRGRAREQRAVP